jgi:serine/threonine protein kinase
MERDDTVAETEPAEAATTTSVRRLERYRLEQVIGRGGMGEVVSARDEQIGRTVAIKRMRNPGASEESIARFVREAQIQGRLEHPAVVPVHELRYESDQPYFVMKQLAGITLADVIELLRIEDPPITAKFTRQRLLRAFTEVCLAIEFAHTRGVVHRDLKPANIMLGDFGEVYVLDWGIARFAGEAPGAGGDAELSETRTVAGTMMGTPGYMSPEQVRGDADLDGRADVYALGCILFEILAGEPLHPRGKPGIDSAVAGTADARPSLRASEIPPELDAACVAATQGDRAKRIANARELGDRVQRYLDGDRDIALRQALAKTEVELARRELARGLEASLRTPREDGLLSSFAGERSQAPAPRDAIEAYAAAMQASARALALDPKSRDAAELVGRLMLEPPADVPPAVEQELGALEMRALSNQARIGVRAMVGYLIFFPIMYLGGLRDPWHVIGGAALVLGIMLLTYAIARRPAWPLIYASFVANVLLIALFARILTPFLVAPGVALVTLMVYASHPRLGNGWVLAAGCASGVLVPLAIELAGWAATTTAVDGARIVMTLPTTGVDPTVAIAGLSFYVIVILSMSMLLSRLQAVEQRRMQRKLQLQAWQLRQLAPVTTTPLPGS